MVKLSSIIAALIDADGTYDQIMAVTLAFEEAEEEAPNELEQRRAKDRERQKRWRDRLNMSAADWEARKGEVLQRDNHTCRYCGKSGDGMHVDHVTPLIQGGTNDLDNLVCACAECNTGKSGRTPEQWRGDA